MIRRWLIVSVLVVAGGVSTLSAADKTSFGLGVGALYNGLGGNFALIKADDLKYISVGCSEFTSSSIDGTFVTCGVGIGWLKSNILTKKKQQARSRPEYRAGLRPVPLEGRTLDSLALRLLFPRTRSQGLESRRGASRSLGYLWD